MLLVMKSSNCWFSVGQLLLKLLGLVAAVYPLRRYHPVHAGLHLTRPRQGKLLGLLFNQMFVRLTMTIWLVAACKCLSCSRLPSLLQLCEADFRLHCLFDDLLQLVLLLGFFCLFGNQPNLIGTQPNL